MTHTGVSGLRCCVRRFHVEVLEKLGGSWGLRKRVVNEND